MDIRCKKTLFLLLLCVLGQITLAQNTISKTLSETHNMSVDGEIRVQNKYGTITVNGWDKEKIGITAQVTVSHKEEEYATRLLARISPQIKTAKNYVAIHTEILEEQIGFFSRYFKKSHKVKDKHAIEVNYTIYLPRKAQLMADNLFGDIIIEDYEGNLTVNVAHGDVWLNSTVKNLTLNLKHGKLKATRLTQGKLKVNNGTLELSETQNIILHSSGSTIAIKNIRDLELYGNKDEIVIDTIASIKGSLEFGTLQIGQIINLVDMHIKISDLGIGNMSAENTSIFLEQESSEIRLHIPNFSFDFDAVLEQGLLRLPKSFENVNSNMLDKGKRIREVTASYGDHPLGRISIKGKKGIILLEE